MDSRLRDLERGWHATGAVEDHAAWLRERVRAGTLPRVELEVAAVRGDAASALASSEMPRALLVVHFWAVWNNHDTLMARTLAEVQAREVDWLLHRVDVDEDQQFAAACNVLSLPTLVAYRAGIERGRIVGRREDAALAVWLRSLWGKLPSDGCRREACQE
mgnify:CR=1 FL=1